MAPDSWCHSVRSAFEEAFFDYLGSFWNADWKHMRSAELKALGPPFVSARAECQVRVRTKDRFCTAAGLRSTCSVVSPWPREKDA